MARKLARGSLSSGDPSRKRAKVGRQAMRVREMQIGAGPCDAPIVGRVADQHGGDAGGPSGLHVNSRVAQIPDRAAGPPPSSSSAISRGAGSGLSAFASPAPTTAPKYAAQPRWATSGRR